MTNDASPSRTVFVPGQLDFRHKRIVILGLARQGAALARFFVRQGAQVVISDAAPADKLTVEQAAIADLPVEWVLGGHPLSLLDRCDLLCLSGGVPPQIEVVQAARARGIPLSNDSLLTCQLARQLGLGPLIAITGSSGKTTTTTLVGLMLQASGKRVHVGGNIGVPLIDRLHLIQPGDSIVLELSSFQLELFDPAVAWGECNQMGPDIAAILNITPNHLDRHPTMAAYAAAKLNLLRFLPQGAQVVVSADDPVTARLVSSAERIYWSLPKPDLPASWALDMLLADMASSLSRQQATPIPFSRQQPLPVGAWLADETLVYHGAPICQRHEVRLRGDHNISNLLAAAAVSGAAGAQVAAMRQVARSFAGVPHRLEVVAEHQGVLWINDSIATSPERAVAALRSFPLRGQTLILLAGGKDKNLPWETFTDEALQQVNFLIGFGQAGAMIVNTVQERAQYAQKPAPSCAVVQRLDEAVELAARVAYNHPPTKNGATRTTPHTVVLLSPGGASYDAYKDFEARGEHFRQLVVQWTPEGQVGEHEGAG
jgi:UDP-N-acetylmuramoylalanine--D-glutamate ligase